MVPETEACTFSCPVMSDSLQPHGLCAHQAPLSVEFSRQKYWSGLPFPSPEDLSDPQIKLGSPALQADSLPSEPPGNTKKKKQSLNCKKKMMTPECQACDPDCHCAHLGGNFANP